MNVGIGLQGLFQAVGEGSGQFVGGQDRPSEVVRRLRRERWKANRLEEAHSPLQVGRVVNETPPLVELPVAGHREAGRFVREVGKADEAQNLGHSWIRAMIASTSVSHMRKGVLLQKGRRGGGIDAVARRGCGYRPTAATAVDQQSRMRSEPHRCSGARRSMCVGVRSERSRSPGCSFCSSEF